MLTRPRIAYLVSAATLATACGDKVADTLFAPAAAPRAEQTQSRSARQISVASAFAAQKLIRGGDLRIEVKDVRSAIAIADSVARMHGGLLADSRQSQDAHGLREAHLVVRVPSDRFAAAVADLGRLGDVKSEALNTQDITKEYADLATRLTVKDQTVTRLRSLLENRTAKLSDVLDVEKELERSVTELEQLKGEQRYYDRQVAISSISVTLFNGGGSRGGRLLDPIAAAFAGSLEVLGNSLGSVTYVVVFLLPWAAVVGALWWVAARLGARKFAPGRQQPSVTTE